MSRLLFLLVVIAAVYLLLKSYSERASGAPPVDRTEDMVRCMYCGVHLPKSESVMVDGKHFCNDAHYRAYHSPPPSSDAG